MEIFISFLVQLFVLCPTLLFGSTGEIITEKSGNLNLGTPGIMTMGAIGSIFGSFMYVQKYSDRNIIFGVFLSLIFAVIFSALTTFIYCYLTISLRTNQNVTGLALTTFGVGLSNCLGSVINDKMSGNGIAAFPELGKAFKFSPFSIGKTEGFLGIINRVFLSYSFMAYLAVIIAVIASLIIFRTRIGLNLRSVGENPATADAAGINVNRYKYLATMAGGIISGFGGAYYVMVFANANWQNNILDQFGWLAVALVIFAFWRPVFAILGSVVFSGLYVVGTSLLTPLKLIGQRDQKLIDILPYLVTIIVLVVSSTRKKPETQPPASLGLSYFREER